jgi:hypothetical protein
MPKGIGRNAQGPKISKTLSKCTSLMQQWGRRLAYYLLAFRIFLVSVNWTLKYNTVFYPVREENWKI